MNMKLLGAFVVALLLVLLLPLLGGAMRSTGAASSAEPIAASATPKQSSTAPVAAQAAPVSTDASIPEIPSVAQAPPMLDQASLAGTAWRVSHKMGTIDVELFGGGVARAKHMLIGELQGSWRVDGATVVVTASIANRTETIKVQIRGTDLYYDGVAIARLR